MQEKDPQLLKYLKEKFPKEVAEAERAIAAGKVASTPKVAGPGVGETSVLVTSNIGLVMTTFAVALLVKPPPASARPAFWAGFAEATAVKSTRMLTLWYLLNSKRVFYRAFITSAT